MRKVVCFLIVLGGLGISAPFVVLGAIAKMIVDGVVAGWGFSGDMLFAAKKGVSGQWHQPAPIVISDAQEQELIAFAESDRRGEAWGQAPTDPR